MSDELTRLFSAFDRGALSRRRLLQALGIAVVGAPLTRLAEPLQGRCGGANAGTPACDTTPAPLPFEVTGWRTVVLDRFTVQVADYQKEAAYYAALMNWKIRSDDGKQAVLDIGDIGSVVIRGGYEPPAAPASGGPPGRAPRRAVWDSFCWGIEPWDTKKVESELKKRELEAIPAHEGKDFQSFIVTGPDGFKVQVSNGNASNRRTTPANGKVSAPAPFESTSWKTVWLDHISYQSPDYKKSVAFYTALLGWQPTGDEGSQNDVRIGDIGGILIRGGGPPRVRAEDTAGGRPAPAPQRPRIASIDHISFGIAGFEPDAVKAELDKRGLNARVDTGGRGDIHTAPYKSYHTTTPNGFDLQISNRTSAER
jgi:catechol 2,3-dioxygenase-like lactoylglutathione lyase family enzyme